MKTISIDNDRTTTLVADEGDADYIVNGSIRTSGTAIDASAPVTGRTFTINRTLSADAGTAVIIGSAPSDPIYTTVKIADTGSFSSGGKGIVVAGGHIGFENVGLFTTVRNALEFTGNGNTFLNNGTNGRPGTITSSKGSVLVTSGMDDTINNNALGILRARADAIAASGTGVEITNDGKITSTTGSAIFASGRGAEINNTGALAGKIAAIVSSGAGATITNGDGTIKSGQGAGIVSSGTGVTITNHAVIATAKDGIASSGAGATITNDGTITSSAGAGIRSTGDKAIITVESSLTGKVAGIVANGDGAVISNTAAITGKSVGISIGGDDATLRTHAHIQAATAISISGDGATIVNTNDITGTSKKAATIEITASGATSFTNNGAVSTGSGTVIEAGNGAETVINNGSLYGVVNLGGGNDLFNSTGVVTGAVNAGNGNDRIVNTGELQYDVNLGAGNDVFISMKGVVGGKVYGGAGNDRYVIAIDLDIVEKAGGGIDSVESRYTFKLGANIENLKLTGNGNMEATGNSLANRIEGNAGDNRLTGLGGKDVFVFEKGFARDVVTDFTDHKDLIDFSGYAGIDRFADLRGKISNSGNDVVITLDGHDRLTLLGVHKAELGADDFIF